MASIDHCIYLQSHMLHLLLKVYAKREQQEFVNVYMLSLRPEVSDALRIAADRLFPPGIAKLVKQSVEEKWIYGS